MSTASFNKTGVSVYPIPAKDVLNLAWDNLKPSKVMLYDTAGKLLQTVNNTSDKKLQIKVSKYPKGVYILKYDIDNKTYSEKIIVE
ncbi:hypothetical protein D3C72_2005210 [compost metagenome]